MAQIPLGEMLVSAGRITSDQLQEALDLQKDSTEHLGAVLVTQGFLTEQELSQALQRQLNIPFVDLTRVEIPTEMARVLPKSLALQFGAVPVSLDSKTLRLAMSDPLNFYAIDEARKCSKRRVVPLLATRQGIAHAIEVLYSSEGAAKAIAEMKREAAARGEGQETPGNPFAANRLEEDSAAGAPAIRLVSSILERAVTERASDIHLEPRESAMQVRMRVDGLMRTIMTVPKDIQGAVISRLKIMSGMDIAERRVPQDGRFNIRVRDRDIDLRVSTLPTVYGEKLAARLLDKSSGGMSKQDIGLRGADLEKYDAMLRIHSGALLLAGPTGSGKTTTMYAMLRQLNTPEANLVTLEDPIEYAIDGVNQVQINEKAGMTFAGGLRAILRQDPDIIAVGEIRDGETADIAMRSAITGHVVLSTVHTDDTVGAIDRLRDIGVEPYMIAAALKGVISQRLLRRICPNCRAVYAPGADEVAALGLRNEPGLRLYRGAGCQECANSGYRGRIAVFEMLPISHRVRSLIYAHQGREAIEQELKRPDSGFVSLWENALLLVREGVTTGAEALRVLSSVD